MKSLLKLPDYKSVLEVYAVGVFTVILN